MENIATIVIRVLPHNPAEMGPVGGLTRLVRVQRSILMGPCCALVPYLEIGIQGKGFRIGPGSRQIREEGAGGRRSERVLGDHCKR